MNRKILHLDLDAFFCAVEELRRPELCGKPFAVGGRPDERGVVSSCSYPARRCGVHSAMPMVRAVRICPELVIVPPDHARYAQASEAVMAYLRSLSPLVEQVSVDEAFLDLSDLPQSGEELARQIQAEIGERFHLPCSAGVATNKLVAKIATDVGKGRHKGDTPPCAVQVVAPGEEAAFLAPLPVIALWGVGPKTSEALQRLGLYTIADLAAAPESMLVAQFGKNGHDLSRHARGLDPSPVTPFHELKSISQEITFERDVADPEKLRLCLREMVEAVAYRLRQEGLCASTVRVKVRWPDFSLQTRQHTLDEAVDQDGAIYTLALSLFEQLWERGRPVRLLGVGVSGLGQPVRQLSLWETPSDKERRLNEAVDDLRQRFGAGVVQRGRSAGKEE